MKSFSVLCWNVQGRFFFATTPFEKVARYMNKINSDFICLQEMPEVQKKIQLLKDRKDFEIISAKSNTSKDVSEYNHTVILSRHKVIDWGEIVFPSLNNQQPERSIWCKVSVNNRPLTIYSCHLAIKGIGMSERIEQLNTILAHADRLGAPTIICGDMNTNVPAAGWSRKFIQFLYDIPRESFMDEQKYCHQDERYIFPKKAYQQGYREITNIQIPTWCIPHFKWELLRLKLDWFLIRDIEATQVSYGPYISDHRPILAHLRF